MAGGEAAGTKTPVTNEYDQRFGGVARLCGAAGLERLRRAHVCVVGVGGVGSWTVEALARSGVGELTLVDLDDVCVTNVNRQLPALASTVGRPKVVVLAERVADINAGCVVHPIPEFFTAANAARLLEPGFDHVVDAIDSPSLKARLIASCRERDLPVITAGGAGGRRDPTRVRVADLAHTSHDPLLAAVRSLLRRDYGFPHAGQLFGVDCVFSQEPIHYPAAGEEACEVERGGEASGSACERPFGTATFVTGTFGFAAAAQVMARLTGLPGLAAGAR